jgi:acetolactate synthase-1/2/3 large subunit
VPQATSSEDDRTNVMQASDLFIKALEEEGVEYIFGIPGEENTPLSIR